MVRYTFRSIHSSRQFTHNQINQTRREFSVSNAIDSTESRSLESKGKEITKFYVRIGHVPKLSTAISLPKFLLGLTRQPKGNLRYKQQTILDIFVDALALFNSFPARSRISTDTPDDPLTNYIHIYRISRNIRIHSRAGLACSR